MTTASPPPHARSLVAAGYTPLDIVAYNDRVWHAAGGTAGNVAAISSFLGARASIVADVGDDLAGRRVRRDLQKANVDVSQLRLNPRIRTPRLIHRITARGHRFEFRCPTCQHSFPPSRPLTIGRAGEVAGVLEAPDVCFVDRLNPGTLLLAEQLYERGSAVVFEPSRPARPDFERRILTIASLVKYAHDRRPDLQRADARCGQIWIETCGAAGARYRIGTTKWRTSPAFPYPVIDAGGAGDWTTAGLIHALDLTASATLPRVGDALRWAQALAAVSCGAPGARGLARQQSAEDVLRSAHFLEQRQGSEIQGANVSWRESSSPETVCRWCLEAIEIGATGTATDGTDAASEKERTARTVTPARRPGNRGEPAA
jgi:sugar/nucleoside kinase (ribokinase family)